MSRWECSNCNEIKTMAGERPPSTLNCPGYKFGHSWHRIDPLYSFHCVQCGVNIAIHKPNPDPYWDGGCSATGGGKHGWVKVLT